MKNFLLSLGLFFNCITCSLAQSRYLGQAKIVTYPVPKQLYYSKHNDDYTVKVRQVGEKEWIDLYEYNVKVDMDTQSDASMVQFDFSGKIEVLVQKNNEEVRSVNIRPLSKHIIPKVEGRFVSFILDKPQNLSIEFNDDRLHNLHLFANSIETDIPDKNASNVMYFEAGMHEPTDSITKSFRIPSNTIVYLEGGAVLKGRLVCDSVENVKVLGHGMLLEPQQGISITYSKNVLIDGITVVDPHHYTVSGGQSTGITIKNLKSFSYQGWADGLDFMSCSNILIDDVFMRNSDDCLAFYTHRWDFYGDCRKVRVQNSTLWADIAHPINIGTHGNTVTGDEVLEDMLFSNLDILEQDEDDRDYQGCMAINVGDHNLARDITFEDIRVENIQEGQLFYLRVMYNQKYNTGPGKGVKNIVFRNITCNAKYVNPSLIEGYDENRTVDDISFENVVLNGRKITSLDDLNLNLNRKKYVGKLRIK
ncbi:glycosyl hydrolase family 28 protein [uncultured Bacteroides sp.]|uniref:glycosyl hydrolase family 28 protein n=1 Tax=uncultured Bacteroides sp. TaxID=162156 RepID=UPI002AA84DF4|nr:glycosyl hydrolase family 28 protein [uncultured Bacteroides sp.]